MLLAIQTSQDPICSEQGLLGWLHYGVLVFIHPNRTAFTIGLGPVAAMGLTTSVLQKLSHEARVAASGSYCLTPDKALAAGKTVGGATDWKQSISHEHQAGMLWQQLKATHHVLGWLQGIPRQISFLF